MRRRTEWAAARIDAIRAGARTGSRAARAVPAADRCELRPTGAIQGGVNRESAPLPWKRTASVPALQGELVASWSESHSDECGQVFSSPFDECAEVRFVQAECDGEERACGEWKDAKREHVDDELLRR